MINVNIRVRRATAEDHEQISTLLFNESSLHRHLDWRSPLDWIGDPNFWVVEDNGRLTAALACPEDPVHVAWVRLFAYHTHLTGPETWYPLWEKAKSEIFSGRRVHVAAIVLKRWFQNLLTDSGFHLKQDIVLLELRGEHFKPHPVPTGIHIRRMTAQDLPLVTDVDLDAFGEFWHNSLDALTRALSQSIYATVAEDEHGVIGYQLSTGNPFGAHLARLGVRKEAHGRGVGSALVSDLVEWLNPNQMARLSVNTQSDNSASLALYHRLGFRQTGEYYPVMTYHGEH